MIVQNNILKEFEQYQSEFESEAVSSLRSGWYVLGERLHKFEVSFVDCQGLECQKLEKAELLED